MFERLAGTATETIADLARPVAATLAATGLDSPPASPGLALRREGRPAASGAGFSHKGHYALRPPVRPASRNLA